MGFHPVLLGCSAQAGCGSAQLPAARWQGLPAQGFGWFCLATGSSMSVHPGGAAMFVGHLFPIESLISS